MTWHGWLYPYLTGLLGRLFSSTFIGITIIETVIVGVGCLLYARVVESIKGLSVWMGTALVVPVTAVALSFMGRPESLAFFLVICGMVGFRYLGDYECLRFWLTTLLWGGVGATQPTAALLMGPILLGYLVVSTPNVFPALKRWVLLGAASVATTFLLTLLLYPHPTTDWVVGLLAHAEKITDRRSSGTLLYYYFLQPSLFMQGLWLLPIPLFFVFSLYEYSTKKVYFVSFILIFLSFLVWYTSLRVPPANYNFFFLVPTISFALVVFSLSKLPTFFNISFYLLIFLIFLSSISSIMRRSLINCRSLLYGSSPEELRSVASSFSDNGRISMDAGIVISSYPPSDWGRLSYSGNISSCDTCKYYFKKQSSTSTIYPPPLEGYEVLVDNFSKERIFIGPIKIANTDNSYNFAVYKKVK